MTGDETFASGNGFLCGGGGDFSRWIDNVSRDNSRSGFSLGCQGGDEIVFRNNMSRNNCRYTQQFAPDVTIPVGHDGFREHFVECR